MANATLIRFNISPKSSDRQIQKLKILILCGFFATFSRKNLRFELELCEKLALISGLADACEGMEP